MVKQRLSHMAFVLLVVLGGLILPISSAQACSCAVGTPRESLLNADAVFIGDVLDQRGGMQRVVYTIAVDRVYKGQVAARQEVVTSGDGASCGVTLPRRHSILVFASEAPVMTGHLEAGQLATGLCSGNRRAITVPVGFGPGEPPIGAEVADAVSVLDVSQSDDSGPSLPVVVGSALGLVVLLLGVVTFMRRRGNPGPAAP